MKLLLRKLLTHLWIRRQLLRDLKQSFKNVKMFFEKCEQIPLTDVKQGRLK